jgi:hypothetical protein
MVRKQVYITPAQDALLKQRAEEIGTTESDLIRQGIDRLGQAAWSGPADARAWEDELAFIERRAALPGLGLPRGWTRDELYADRR